MALIEIKNLCKTFGSGDGAVHALEDVSLDIEQGEIFGIIGLSGAGKSTLVRCINLLERPTSGSVTVDGADMCSLSERELRQARREIGMIFQSFNLLMQRNALANVRFPLELAGVPRADANKRAKELLELVGLGDRLRAYPAQLSGGQKQRVAIARALASDPEVLLCDEATSALDPMTTQSILALLKDINERLGITVVVITHEMAVIRQICTRVAILDGGHIAEEGSVDEVFVHTRSAAGKRLFGILPENEDEDRPPVPALRIVFDGGMENQPVIADLVKQCNVEVNILSANIRRLNDKPYGQMLIEMPRDDAARRKIVEFLNAKGLTVKEVWPQ